MTKSVSEQIEAVLLNGTDEEVESLLGVIERIAPDDYLRIYCWTIANREG
jgi:hypothetical protein